MKLGKTSVRTTPDGRLHALEALQALGLEGTHNELERLKDAHQLQLTQHTFADGRAHALSYADFALLAFAAETLEAKRWRIKAKEILGRYLAGDIRLAADVAERSPSREHRRWLSARLESVESRKNFMSTVAKHGGQGSIYREVSSLSNQTVLRMDSSEFRRRRQVRNTRDGMSAAELLRLSYLETATARAIEEKGVKGNEEILKLHRKNAEVEQKLWDDPEFKPGA